jgi:hypothetical protein
VSEFSEALAEAAASVSGAPDYAVSASRRLVSLLWPTGEYKVLMADGSRVIGEGVASSLAWGNGFVKWNGGGVQKSKRPLCMTGQTAPLLLLDTVSIDGVFGCPFCLFLFKF